MSLARKTIAQLGDYDEWARGSSCREPCHWGAETLLSSPSKIFVESI